MKVYTAWSGPMQQLNAIREVPPIRILSSYAYDNGGLTERLTSVPEVDFMADSGAFSVWTVGKKVDLENYITWAKARQAQFSNPVIINLDVIPGAPGKPPTGAERKRAIKQSMENADAIRDAGLPVMEVFHMFDRSWKLMETLWERRRPGEVFGLGGIAGKNTGSYDVADFAKDCFRRVHSWCGGWENIVRVHGLGVSPENQMATMFPWWSIDSSSWNSFHKFGHDVTGSGKKLRKTAGKSKTSVRSVSSLYYGRTIRHWKRLERDYTLMWERRGVTFRD